MIKNLQLGWISIAILLGLSHLSAYSTNVNAALEATVSTSYVSPWEALSAVNDNQIGTFSSSRPSGGIYGNWDAVAGYNWVEYSWPSNIFVETTKVFWFTDFGGILIPSEAYIEYWNGVSWVKIGDIGVHSNSYNNLAIGVWTNKIRITMRSSASTGIVEWQVWATQELPCEVTASITWFQINAQEETAGNNVIAQPGDKITISAITQESGQWYWSGPEGFTSYSNSFVIDNAQLENSGSYEFVFVSDCGGSTSSFVNVTVLEKNDGSEYQWASYSPEISYDFRDEYPTLAEPTQDLLDVEALGEVAGRISDGWWTFTWGPKAKSVITEDAVYPMLERFNQDFAYFRDVMGWPPDKRAKNGYRSAIYLFGSGLATDNADSTALGGWQGAVNYQNQSWPNVLASYYPVYAFDPNCPYGDREAQMGAMIHEGIHALLADLPGAKKSAWFHEGGNTWLQQEMESAKSGDYSSMGFLNAGAMVAPFMPIECYSGWLQDESFGGPSAEGVNMFEDNQQICTWKNLLGGNQYGNMFPVILSQVLGDKSVPWVWRNCENRVLEGIAETLGDYQIRRLISEYRARQAVLDIGKWSGASRSLLDGSFGNYIGAEWQPSWLNPELWHATPYANSWVDSDGWINPEYRTSPGWSGANQIPLITQGSKVIVDFNPYSPGMTCQLCYRAKDGSIIYGERIFGGQCSLNLTKAPSNQVVFAVVCNTDYIYKGEETRKKHHTYKIKPVEGVVERAHWDVRWYQWDVPHVNLPLPNKVPNTVMHEMNSNAVCQLFPNPLDGRSNISITLPNEMNGNTQVEVYDLKGSKLYESKLINSKISTNEVDLESGIYLIKIKGDKFSCTDKLMVR